MNPYLRVLKWILLAGVTATGVILLTALASTSASNTGDETSSDYPAAAFGAALWAGAFTFLVLLFWLTASAAAWRSSATVPKANPQP